MNLTQAKKELRQYRYLIGHCYREVLIADILIMPIGVGRGFIMAVEELSEQEGDYFFSLKDFKHFVLLATFAHPYLQAIAVSIILENLW